MRFPSVALLVLLLINVFVDFFIYKGLRRWTKIKWLGRAHAAFSTILHIILAVSAFLAFRSGENSAFVFAMWGLLVFASVYVPKYLYAVFSLFAAVPALFGKRKWVACEYVGAVLGVVCFMAMWWGALVTARQTEVREVELFFPELPQAFDGYRIVQFSDLHTGTFGRSTRTVERVVDCINGLHPDLIAFTGDIVNRNTDEIIPFTAALSKLKAADGVVSVLGNHDYGDYFHWKDERAKRLNLQRLIGIQKDRLRWRLLCNEHVFLKRGGDSIAVIGVENWGEPPFSTHGNLGAAYPGANDGNFKMLVSHNPKHWETVVADSTGIALTLSGHTHAMQMMWTVGNVRFSPASWRYDRWQGLYGKNGIYLYVNAGIGEVGMPMRIGAVPELTLITLRRGNHNGGK